MFQVWNLLVALTFVSVVAASAEARRSLFEYCRDLSESLEGNPEVYRDAQTAYKMARSRLKSIFNLGVESRSKLASAWKAVVKEAPCDARSHEHIAVIAECAPELDHELRTLDRAMRKYATRCQGASFWDRLLSKATSNKDKSGITEFIDDNFILKYFEDNPTDPEIHFGEVKGVNCCKPARGRGAMFGALKSRIGLDQDYLLTSYKLGELDKRLHKYLSEACEKYNKILFQLMSRAEDSAKHHPKGEHAFIKELSLDFQHAIFRYKYCSSIKSDKYF